MRRYLDIMIDGCRHFGVSQKHVDFLLTHECQPRPAPEDFRSFGDPPTDAPHLTLAEVNEGTGRHGRPLLLSFNSRVLECTLGRDSEDFRKLVDVHAQVGHVGEKYVSKLAYDPKYGVPEELNGFTEEHSAYLEDLFIGYNEFSGLSDAWTPITWFDQCYLKEKINAPSG